MATVKTDFRCDLTKPVQVQYLDGNLFTLDNGGNTINVYCYEGEEPATLGGSVSANVIRPDGTTVPVSGAIDGNKAYVILPQAAYAVPGYVTIIVKVTQNTTVTTIAAIVANNMLSSTDTIVDPGTIIPSVQALIAQIEAAVGSIPADYSALLLMLAKNYTSSKTYIVGEYAWQAGVLKRCIVPITAGETYTAAHWTNAVIGDDLSALKGAFDVAEDELFDFSEMTADSTVSGWRLVENTGLCLNNSSYKLVKYKVTAGDIVKVVSDDRFQFQTVASVPASGSSNRVGITYGDGTYLLKVPATATYLIVDTPVTDSAAKVYAAASNIDAIESEIADIESATEFKYALFEQYAGVLNNTLKWTAGGSNRYTIIPVKSGQKIHVISNGTRGAQIAALKSYTTPATDDSADMSTATGWTSLITVGTNSSVGTLDDTIPNDTNYLYVYLGSANNRLPTQLTIDGYDIIKTITSNITDIRKNIVDPDNFPGTDNEKLAAAMSAIGFEGHGVILIKRKYTLTSALRLNHSAYADSYMIFLGIGGNGIIDTQSNSILTVDSTQSYGMVKFDNIKFSSTNEVFITQYLIRLFFEGCVFDSGTYAFYNARFMQTYYFHNCTFRNFSTSIIRNTEDGTMLDVSFSQCLMEFCNSFIISVGTVAGVTVYQCCIEGFYGKAFNVQNEVRGLFVEGCYFENNNNGTYQPEGVETNDNGCTFDFHRTTGHRICSVVRDNKFTYLSGNEIIVLRGRTSRHGEIIVTGNWVNPALPDGAILVKTADSASDIHFEVVIDSNAGAKYDNGSLIWDRGESILAFTNMLTDSDNANTLTHPGVFYGADENSIANAPTTGEFYLINMKSDEGSAQIAVTAEGIKSRMNNGEWV